MSSIDHLLQSDGIDTKNVRRPLSTLILFDNADNLIKCSLSSFALLLKYYTEECRFRVVLGS
jgi:hypothetical protein